ncbi:uncharacterized protein LOC110104521 isoform X2 [Dendrobium catenatum]|uniref:uncharacterized protein LOC110104521 isoform X2 n=1 Tax=Dendrobium catenatum TaxID=906689 RepID=UPI0010A007B3|nr:uncharacterized protein LOC110104521 isoform X2 [Dendrobium catenatum]
MNSVLFTIAGLVLADCSASSETVELLKQGIDLGCCIVLANKKPLTSKIEEFDKLTSDFRHIRFESTVGAGLPVIASITRVLSSGDPIYRIIGSLSDPRDDLGGMDVARKALILARLLGQRINLEDIKVDSLYPDNMGPKSISVDDFINHVLPLLDSEVGEKVAVAASKGNVLRYVCMIEGSRCQVGLQELPKDCPLGRLRGSDNVVEIYSRCYKNSPLVIQGAGAGNDTTAAGVLADIVDLQDLFN